MFASDVAFTVRMKVFLAVHPYRYPLQALMTAALWRQDSLFRLMYVTAVQCTSQRVNVSLMLMGLSRWC